MKINHVGVLLLYIVFLVIACQKNESLIQSSLVTIDTTVPNEHVKLTDLLTFQGCTVLNNSEKGLIFKIDKLLFAQDEIFVLNDANGNFEQIMIFDEKTGAFKRNIGQHGEGPGAYFGLRDIAFTASEEEEVTGLVAGDMSLKRYKKDGTPIRNNRTHFFGDEIEASNNNFLIYNEFNATDETGDNFLILTDSEGKILKTFFPYHNPKGMGFEFAGFLNQSSQNIWFNPPFSDTIYLVNQGEYSPAYCLNFGQKRIPDHLKANVDQIDGYNIIENSHLLEDFCKIGNVICFSYKDGRSRTIGIFNEATEEFYSTKKCQDDYLKKILSFGHFTAKNDNTLVFILTPERWIYLRDNDENFIEALSLQNPSLYNSLKNMDSTSNPALLYFNFKNF